MICSLLNIQFRFFHVTKNVYQISGKTHLATLRKATGHSISNCKKALDENNMDLEKAKKWLEDQAQKEGWEKAIKLQARITNQGLIGLHLQGKTAALIEVACETDFVAKNNYFKDLVKTITKTCCTQLSNNLNIQNGQVIKQNITASQLGELTNDNTKMKDQVAKAISHLGENIRLKRGLLVKCIENVELAGAVHPHPETEKSVDSTITGSYAALIAVKSPKQLDEIIGHQLCMQIIGMNPLVINRPHDPVEIEAKGKREEKATQKETNEEEEELEVEEEKNEISLLHQDFIFNPDMIVKEVVEQKEIEIIDFIRLECGESETLAQV